MFIRWKKRDNNFRTHRRMTLEERATVDRANAQFWAFLQSESTHRKELESADLTDEERAYAVNAMAHAKAGLARANAAAGPIWKSRRVQVLEAHLVASYRNDEGQPRQQVVAYLGSIVSDELEDEDDRFAFWHGAMPKLAAQADTMNDREIIRAIGKLAATVPPVDEGVYREWKRFYDLAVSHPDAAQDVLSMMTPKPSWWRSGQDMLNARLSARDAARMDRELREWWKLY